MRDSILAAVATTALTAGAAFGASVATLSIEGGRFAYATDGVDEVLTIQGTLEGQLLPGFDRDDLDAYVFLSDLRLAPERGTGSVAPDDLSADIVRTVRAVVDETIAALVADVGDADFDGGTAVSAALETAVLTAIDSVAAPRRVGAQPEPAAGDDPAPVVSEVRPIRFDRVVDIVVDDDATIDEIVTGGRVGPGADDGGRESVLSDFAAYLGTVGPDAALPRTADGAFDFDLDVTAAPVPLPSGLPLLAAGLAAVGLLARRGSRSTGGVNRRTA